METLYIDNFRGFSDLFIPLKDVNFFVGENSTGKTSILSILSLLSNDRFWYEQSFNDSDVQLGNFKDIVSVDSKDKSNFKIGLINISEKAEKTFSFLLVFSEHEGRPYVTRFHFIIGESETSIYLSENIQYEFAIRKDIGSTMNYFVTLMKEWAQSKKHLKDVQTIEAEFSTKQEGLFYTIMNVQHEIYKKRSQPSKGVVWFRRSLSFTYVIREALSSVVWLAPIRSTPKRTYDDYRSEFSSDGKHIPYLIKKILGTTSEASKFLEFVKNFGIDSGLMESLSIEKYGEDEYISPFSLLVKLNNTKFNLKFVGYGVSQILPVLVEVFYRGKGSRYAIQQPEVHLHPRAQAAIGKIIHIMAFRDKKKFFIETHSDFMIDRFRAQLKKETGFVDSQVLFFCRKENVNTITPISIDSVGQYDSNQPREFREFFINEELSNLGIR